MLWLSAFGIISHSYTFSKLFTFRTYHTTPSRSERHKNTIGLEFHDTSSSAHHSQPTPESNKSTIKHISFLLQERIIYIGAGARGRLTSIDDAAAAGDRQTDSIDHGNLSIPRGIPLALPLSPHLHIYHRIRLHIYTYLSAFVQSLQVQQSRPQCNRSIEAVTLYISAVV